MKYLTKLLFFFFGHGEILLGRKISREAGESFYGRQNIIAI